MALTRKSLLLVEEHYPQHERRSNSQSWGMQQRKLMHHVDKLGHKSITAKRMHDILVKHGIVSPEHALAATSLLDTHRKKLARDGRGLTISRTVVSVTGRPSPKVTSEGQDYEAALFESALSLMEKHIATNYRPTPLGEAYEATTFRLLSELLGEPQGVKPRTQAQPAPVFGATKPHTPREMAFVTSRRGDPTPPVRTAPTSSAPASTPAAAPAPAPAPALTPDTPATATPMSRAARAWETGNKDIKDTSVGRAAGAVRGGASWAAQKVKGASSVTKAGLGALAGKAAVMAAPLAGAALKTGIGLATANPALAAGALLATKTGRQFAKTGAKTAAGALGGAAAGALGGGAVGAYKGAKAAYRAAGGGLRGAAAGLAGGLVGGAAGAAGGGAAGAVGGGLATSERGKGIIKGGYGALKGVFGTDDKPVGGAQQPAPQQPAAQQPAAQQPTAAPQAAPSRRLRRTGPLAGTQAGGAPAPQQPAQQAPTAEAPKQPGLMAKTLGAIGRATQGWQAARAPSQQPAASAAPSGVAQDPKKSLAQPPEVLQRGGDALAKQVAGTKTTGAISKAARPPSMFRLRSVGFQRSPRKQD